MVLGKKDQQKEDAAKRNRDRREANSIMNTMFEGDSAAAEPTSSTGAAESSTEANAETEISDVSTGTAKYDVEPAAIKPTENAVEAAAAESDSDAILDSGLVPQSDFVYGVMAVNYSKVMETFEQSPFSHMFPVGYKHDLYIAKMDNFINHHIELTSPIANRPRPVMRLWFPPGGGLAE